MNKILSNFKEIINKYSVFIFDVDGTLINSNKPI